MPTSDASWSGKARVIGDLERPDHWYLTAEDQCVFFGEYTARAGYGHSSTNQLIHNLKKSFELRGTPQWRWKEAAIRETGRAIAGNVRAELLARTVVVPIPPSKTPRHADYDDRMMRVARAIGPQADVREVLYTAVERDPAHVGQNHRDPAALRETLALRQELLANPPGHVLLLDDVLTTGCSFTVCKAMLAQAWPDTRVIGLFVARRVVDRDFDFDDLDLEGV
jgi:hypothetical protein